MTKPFSDRFFLLYLFVVLGFVLGPALYASQNAPAGYEFAGFTYNAIDGNSYLAKMRQGWEGEWKFTLPYTSDPGEGTYLFFVLHMFGTYCPHI